MATGTTTAPTPNGYDTQLQHNILDVHDSKPKSCTGNVGCPQIIDTGPLEEKGGKVGRKITTKTVFPDAAGAGQPAPYTVTTAFVTADYNSDTRGLDVAVQKHVDNTVVPTKKMNSQEAYWQEKDDVKASQTQLDDAYSAKSSSETSGLQNGTTAANSLLNQAGSPAKSLLKLANKADKEQAIQKLDIYPTVAPGTAVQQYSDPDSYSADYYRFGKYNIKESYYEIPPKQFSPIVNDKVPSSIRIIGQPADSDQEDDLIPAYTKFILESVQESHAERSQIVETFGDFYVFMFGERPPVYNFTGQLINSRYTNWVTDFMYMYNEFLRGTRCVERNAKILLTYGGRQVEGLILNTSSQTNAANEGAVGFAFSMVVFERKYFNFSEDMGYYTSDNKTLKEDSAFRKSLGIAADPAGKGTATKELSDAINATKKVLTGGPAAGAFSNIA